jgi:cell wall-associated NlpC family hydrolase
VIPAPTHVTRVPLTTVWVDPSSPRPVDDAAVADDPDPVTWLAALDADEQGRGRGRLGLHGRVETQLVAGEPVVVTDTDATGRWCRVAAPWQRSPKDERGYPGWVPSAHLRRLAAGEVAPSRPVAGATASDAWDCGTHPAVTVAREHVGLRYLWSGTSPLGFDCSGLVLYAWRRLGVVISRDAYAQAEAASLVDVGAVEPGDLYFFARAGERVHHVGIVVCPGRMVHASETGGVLVEEDLTRERVDTLVAAGRLPRA